MESFRQLDRLNGTNAARLRVEDESQADRLAIVLVMTSLAPALAIIGFCSRMTCCNHGPAGPLAFSTETNDCCTTIACYETPSAKLTNGTSVPDALLAMPASVHAVPAPPSLDPGAPEVIEPSPPIPTRHRLAILSTFLI